MELNPQDRPKVDGERLAAAVSGIWEKFRGMTLDRVTVLEETAMALLGGTLAAEERRRAEREAHKLAGSVGTFGFSRGSELAREIELILVGTSPLEQSQTLRLSELAVSLRRELEREPAAGAAAPRTRATLLVVDEDRDFTERVLMEAEGRGIAARVVERMSDLRAALATDPPNVVLLDPFCGGDTDAGLRLLAEITTRSPNRPVLVTGYRGTFGERVEAARFGAQGFLQKPISPTLVIDAVLGALRRGDVSGQVLAVDDDPQILETIRAILGGAGLEVSTLADPRDFWDTLEAVRPDVLLLDVDMPHVNGVELCRVVRNETRWSTLPVVFLTARTDPETVNQIFSAGADDYVPKPFVGPELTTRIENRIERVRLYRMLADTDALTGVANRRKSEENIGQLMAVAARQKQPFALAVIDLDHFKRINDKYGHAVGDDVLRRVSKRLRNALRGEDVIGRWGGEEFVIGAFGATKQVLVHRLGEALANLQEEGISVGGESLPLTFSAGVAEFPSDGGDFAAVYRAADASLYQAKSLGRERVLATGWAELQGSDAELVDVALVEDDPVLAELLLHTFATHGYRTRWLRDGEAAIQSLRGPAAAVRARVILLDVNLPGRDGLAVLQELARSGVTAETRVIMLTVRSTETEVVRSLELGAFDHVAKPFSVPVLLRRIHTALQKG